jgi:hypothetical protein
MQAGDADPFSALAAALERAGHAAAAGRLRDALASGSTGTEALGSAGAALRELRRELPCLRERAFASLVRACLATAGRASRTPLGSTGAAAPRLSAATLFTLAAAFALLGAVVSWMADGSAELPAREILSVRSGAIVDVQRSRSALTLRLAGDDRPLRYLSKSGEIRRVEEALRAATGATATLRHDAAGPPFTIYELSVPGRIERSYEQVNAAWRGDEALGEWLGIGFLAIGAAFALRALTRGRGP